MPTLVAIFATGWELVDNRQVLTISYKSFSANLRIAKFLIALLPKELPDRFRLLMIHH